MVAAAAETCPFPRSLLRFPSRLAFDGAPLLDNVDRENPLPAVSYPGLVGGLSGTALSYGFVSFPVHHSPSGSSSEKSSSSTFGVADAGSGRPFGYVWKRSGPFASRIKLCNGRTKDVEVGETGRRLLFSATSWKTLFRCVSSQRPLEYAEQRCWTGLPWKVRYSTEIRSNTSEKAAGPKMRQRLSVVVFGGGGAGGSISGSAAVELRLVDCFSIEVIESERGIRLEFFRSTLLGVSPKDVELL